MNKVNIFVTVSAVMIAALGCNGRGSADGTIPMTDPIEPEMIFVQGGTFTMGCTAEQGGDCAGDEKPTHRVTLSSFYIGKYEVTQAQWASVMGKNPSRTKGDDLPVTFVSWHTVQDFISKLNAATGKQYRLPTEAEWEYAARGGNRSQGYKYSGSNTVGDVAWYKDNSGRKIQPVGTKAPNELGIHDMSGNVWEWCSDWKTAYTANDKTNPTTRTGSSHVRRGGCISRNAFACRVSRRYASGNTSVRATNLGFRLAISAEHE